MEKFDTIIIGAGPAGLEAALHLAPEYKVLLIEKEASPGGKLNVWDKLFPDFTPSSQVLDHFSLLADMPNLTIKPDTICVSAEQLPGGIWKIRDHRGNEYQSKTVLATTGFDPFNARRKEEYGYGIYPNVTTSVELEEMLSHKELKLPFRKEPFPPRIAFIHCVGSRDEKTGNHYCSRNCCICAVKQAIEVKEMVPAADIYCFYMDLRMFGASYEELYRKAQQDYDIHFIRGRVSEISPAMEDRVVLKAEDTLLGRPLKASFDLVVLMVGMEPSETTRQLAHSLKIKNRYGFINTADSFANDHKTSSAGFFAAGTCKRQMSIPETLKDAAAASLSVIQYLNHLKEND